MFHRFLFIAAVFVGSQIQQPFSAFAQDNDQEVGITEKLGDTIPLNLTFTDEQNRQVKLGDFINKPTILVFIYFACPGICPTLLTGVTDVIERSDMQLGKDFKIITVSFNEEDTPFEAQKKKESFLRSKSKPYQENWIYLTGDSANIRQLANATGFRFKRAGNDFIHPVSLIILSPKGKITRYLYGSTFLPFDLKMAIVEAQKGLSRPTINRVLEFCFSYDPVGHKYSLEVTKISATLIIFMVVVILVVMIIRTERKRAKKNNHSQKTV